MTFAAPSHASLSRPVQVLIALVLLLAALPLVQGTAHAGVAQEQPGFPLPITKFNCESDPGVIGQAEVPEECELVEGVSVTVTDSAGTVQGSCVTDENGTCTVEVSLLEDMIAVVEEDESTGTAGYTPRENPVEVVVNNEFAEAKIVNIKDTEKLPDTGSGPSSASTTPLLAAALLVVAILLASGAGARRQPHS